MSARETTAVERLAAIRARIDAATEGADAALIAHAPADLAALVTALEAVLRLHGPSVCDECRTVECSTPAIEEALA